MNRLAQLLDRVLLILGLQDAVVGEEPTTTDAQRYSVEFLRVTSASAQGTRVRYYNYHRWFLSQVRLITDTVSKAAANAAASIIGEIWDQTTIWVQAPDFDESGDKIKRTRGIQAVYDELTSDHLVLDVRLREHRTILLRLEEAMTTLASEIADLKAQHAAIRTYLITNPEDTNAPHATAEAMVKDAIGRSTTVDMRVQRVKIDRLYDTIGTYNTDGDAIDAPDVAGNAQPKSE